MEESLNEFWLLLLLSSEVGRGKRVFCYPGSRPLSKCSKVCTQFPLLYGLSIVSAFFSSLALRPHTDAQLLSPIAWRVNKRLHTIASSSLLLLWTTTTTLFSSVGQKKTLYTRHHITSGKIRQKNKIESSSCIFFSQLSS